MMPIFGMVRSISQVQPINKNIHNINIYQKQTKILKKKQKNLIFLD